MSAEESINTIAAPEAGAAADREMVLLRHKDVSCLQNSVLRTGTDFFDIRLQHVSHLCSRCVLCRWRSTTSHTRSRSTWIDTWYFRCWISFNNRKCLKLETSWSHVLIFCKKLLWLTMLLRFSRRSIQMAMCQKVSDTFSWLFFCIFF